jgi:hypothetical protein
VPYLYGAIRLLYASPDLLSQEGANASTFLAEGDSLETPEELGITDPEFLFYGNFGLEYCIAERVSLRVGLQNLRRVAFGAGIAVLKRSLVFDFAYLTHHLAGSYAVSVSYRWP